MLDARMAAGESPPLNCPRQPLLWAALAFAAGIVFGAYLWRPPVWWAAAAVLFAIFLSYFVKHRPLAAPAIALLLMFCAGAFMIETRPPADPGWQILQLTDGREVVVTAHVSKEGLLRTAGFGGVRQIIEAESEEITSDGTRFQIRAGMRVSFYSKQPSGQEATQATKLFGYGQRLRFPTKLYAPRNYRNPGAFGYREYLAENGIAALASAKLVDVEVLPGFYGTPAELWRTKVHRSIIDKIHSLWPAREAALIDAMVIGDDEFIARDTRADFQRSGTYHVLVVSGMNVGILAFVIFWVLRRVRASEVLASGVTVLVSIAYALLTDVGPPIWRATLMLTIYLGTRLVYRERSMLNAVGAAAIGVLCFDPRALLSASFQLTFLAVLIIGGIAVPLLERSSQPFLRGLRHLDSSDYDVTLAPRVAQFRLDLRLIAGRLANFTGKRFALPLLAGTARAVLATFEIATVSALMQLGLALPMAYYFHRATVVGLPANLVVIPLTGILMPAAVLAVATSYVLPGLARVAAMVAGVSVDVMNGTVRYLGSMRTADVRVATPEVWVIAVAVVALGLAMVVSRRRPIFALGGLTALALSAACIAVAPPRPQLTRGVLEVTAIDVGQGDSTLVVTPEGKTLLIDAGGPLGGQRSEFDIGEAVVSSYLWSRGISRLDAVMVTHGHSDHIGGMPAILNNFRPRELWIGPIPKSTTFSELLQQARELDITIKNRAAGDQFDFGGTNARVFSPPADRTDGAEPKNNDSLVVLFRYGNTSVLIEGDAEKQIERAIAASIPRADLLKIAHNGSNTSSSAEFLEAVRPHFAIISVGARNTFGHPRREVLARLGNSGTATYRTDLDGAVTFYLDGRKVTPQVSPR